jgi:hypothetical protein
MARPSGAVGPKSFASLSIVVLGAVPAKSEGIHTPGIALHTVGDCLA